MLSLVPIMVCFLSEVVQSPHDLDDNVECFTVLSYIIGTCNLGPKEVPKYVDLLRGLIKKHHELFTRLYPKNAVKPKFHHLLHIIDNCNFLQACLSCFTAERKHRTTKRSAVWVFRGIDNSVLRNLVLRHCNAVSGGTSSLFRRTWMVNPRTTVLCGKEFHYSTGAILSCGSVRKGDVVYLSNDDVGEVSKFWGRSDSEVDSVQVFVFARTAHAHRYSAVAPVARIVAASHIVDACIWAALGETIRVIPPFQSHLRDLL